REFARFCLEQAARFGVNAHYLIAVAQLRSGIVDDTVVGQVGPFRFTHEQWAEARARAACDAEEFDSFEIIWRMRHATASDITSWPMQSQVVLHATASDITSWRMQCEVFAAITARTESRLARRYRRNPEAAETYCAELGATAGEFQELARQIGKALDTTAPLLAEVVFDLPVSLIADYQARVPEGQLIPVSAPDRNVGYVTPL